MDVPEHALELLLAYDGRLHFFASGHYLKFEIKSVERSQRIPHGISYSLTLHAPSGKRILGFDNANPALQRRGLERKRSPRADHWHRTSTDPGRPYEFVSVERLRVDFFTEAERTLAESDIAFEIVDDKDHST